MMMRMMKKEMKMRRKKNLNKSLNLKRRDDRINCHFHKMINNNIVQMIFYLLRFFVYFYFYLIYELKLKDLNFLMINRRYIFVDDLFIEINFCCYHTL
jgi:hypothetical protein